MSTDKPDMPKSVDQLIDEIEDYIGGNIEDIETIDRMALTVFLRSTFERHARLVTEECAKVCDVTPPSPFRPSIEAAHAIRSMVP